MPARTKRICKQCGYVFYSTVRHDNLCSTDCKNLYNINQQDKELAELRAQLAKKERETVDKYEKQLDECDDAERVLGEICARSSHFLFKSLHICFRRS